MTPIAPSTLAPGQRARIPLKLTFAGAGEYALRWKNGSQELRLDHAAAPDREGTQSNGLSLECIFSPAARGGGAAPETPWLAALPRGPAVGMPGYLADYMKQTTIRRFLIY